MSGLLPAAARRPLERPWPAAARALAGAIVAWVALEWGVTRPEPTWRVLAAAAAILATAAVAAPIVARVAVPGVAGGLALASAIGLYLGVPETDLVVGVAAALAMVWFADLTGRLRVDWLIVFALDAVVVFAAVRGAAGRDGAVVGGLAMLGLLVVWPVTAWLPGPARGLVPRSLRPLTLLALHGAYVLVVARRSAIRDDAVGAAVVAAVGVAVLVVATRLAVGRRHP